MKFFWLLLAVVVVAAGTMLFVGRAVHDQKSVGEPKPAPSDIASGPRSAEVNAVPANAPESKPAPELPRVAADPSRENPDAVDHIVAPAKPSSTAAKPAEVGEASAPPKQPPAPMPTEAAPAGTSERTPVPPVPAPAAVPVPSGDSGSLSEIVAAAAAHTTPEGDVIVRHDDEIKIVRKSDGQMVVDDRYALKGDGSEAAPYEITWEYLVSAQETYDPKKGKKKVPERLAMLDGKRVRITGYIAFPLMAQSPKELLAMLNQWDGCCIGVPPTPYDAIEVRLKDAATQEQKYTNYGSVEGVFQVKPYVVGEWLVGLYVMNGANLSSKGSGVGT